MDLRVLPDGPGFRISQPPGSGAKGCRLDGGVIKAIAATVEASLPCADLLLVHTFGKLEAQGRGLYPVISMAEMGIPALVGVNEMNTPDSLAISRGIAEPLQPELRAGRAWYDLAGVARDLAPV